MNLLQYLHDNLILIIPSNIKEKIIKYLNSLDKMYNIKILTMEELKKRMFYDYDKKGIYYLYQNYHLSLNNAKEIIRSLYNLLDLGYENEKLKYLENIKDDLLNHELLIKDPLFYETIKDKEILFWGFTIITKYQKKLIGILEKSAKVTIVSHENTLNKKEIILNFKTIENEIDYIFNDILNKNLNPSKVFFANVNKENESTIKKISKFYHLKVNFNNEKTIFDTIDGQNFLNNMHDLDKALSLVKTPEIKNAIINILNEYYFIENKNEIKNLLTEEFKTAKLKNLKYQNAVNIVELKDNYFNDDEYIYLLDFNREYIPKVYKDEDFINDKEKPSYLENTIEKNNNEIIIWESILNNTPNLFISSTLQNLGGSLEPSPLIKELNLETKNVDYIPSGHSHESNLYNLGLILDDYIKFNLKSPSLEVLLKTYPNQGYQSYNNKYQKVNLQNYNFNLSYSKMNTYYECPFRYYLDNVLKLNKFESTFDAWLGSLCHYILSEIYYENKSFESSYETFIKNNEFELTPENEVFTNKIMKELKGAIKYIKSLSSQNKYQNIECEKNINIMIDDTKFIGIIDKIMMYEDKVVLIDYKTGNPEIDLRLAKYGLNLQLPCYLYLIKKLYPDSLVVGIYLQHILKPIITSDFEKNETEIYENYLKLDGYTLGNEELLKDFDPTYENSDFIKGMKMTQNGFSKYAKILTANDFNYLYNLTESKIKDCIKDIKNAEFKIAPKMLGNTNLSCEFCPYKSVCYMTDKDLEYLTIEKELKLGDDIDA